MLFRSSQLVRMTFAALAISAPAAMAQTVTVSGQCNPWLAGMPNGSLAGNGLDTAPAQSPVLIPTPVIDGLVFTFSVTGRVGNYAGHPLDQSPDGGNFFSRVPGAENGIADLVAPINCVVGVFLDSSQPNALPAPARLDFSIIGLGFSVLSPELRQPFFIGNGLTGTGSGSIQRFVAPPGATRLFVGSMDEGGWLDNVGAYEVTVSATCRGDLNGDHLVNLTDLSILLANFGSHNVTYAQGDGTGDGFVGLDDLSILLARFGANCGS